MKNKLYLIIKIIIIIIYLTGIIFNSNNKIQYNVKIIIGSHNIVTIGWE